MNKKLEKPKNEIKNLTIIEPEDEKYLVEMISFDELKSEFFSASSEEEIAQYNHEIAKLELAQFIADERRRQLMSQTELAEKSGSNRVSISRYENAKLVPSFESLIDICAALHIKLTLEAEAGGKKVSFL